MKRKIKFDYGSLVEQNHDFEFTLLPTILCRRDYPDFLIIFGWGCFFFSIELRKDYGC